MASLIVHGDLQLGEAPSGARSTSGRYWSMTPQRTRKQRRLTGCRSTSSYLAVRRLLEGDANSAAAAPSVVVINLSLGDLNRPFTGRMSPWARLLDWLAFQYRVLFLVSVGNVRRSLPVRDFATRHDFLDADEGMREQAIIAALNLEKASRSLLSPAEGMSALAVGAWHADGFDHPPEPLNLTDPFPTAALPNVSSAVGIGYRRSIKPDLLFDGGRELVRAAEDGGHIWLTVDGGGTYAGQLAATPDAAATGRLNMERRTVGSSNATALLTRSAVRIHDTFWTLAAKSPGRMPRFS